MPSLISSELALMSSGCETETWPRYRASDGVLWVSILSVLKCKHRHEGLLLVVKNFVFCHPVVPESIPLGAGLGVLGEAHYSISLILAMKQGTNNMQDIVMRSTTMSLEDDMVLGRLATEHWLQTSELFKPSRTMEWGFMIVPC